MVEFKETSFGQREMVGAIESVHLDKVNEVCKVTGSTPRSQQLHFIINPSKPEGWKKQNYWLYDTNSSGSSWYDFVRQCVKIGIISEDDVKSATDNLDLAQKIVTNAEGKSFKWGERRLGRALRPNWFPEEVA